MAVNLQVDLDLDTKRTEQEAKRRLAKAGSAAGTSFSIGFSSALKIGAGLVAIRAVSSAIRLIKDNVLESVSAARQLEVFNTQFKTILGSASAAKKQIADLQDFAAKTPFQLPGLARAARQLLSFGIQQEKIIPTLRELGDLAAGAGAEINELTTPFGRLVSTQKLTLIELDKFNDRGINLYQEFAKQTGRSIKDVRVDIEKGRVDFDEFTKAITNLTSAGGTFFGATVAQSKTLSGLFSTLNDNVFALRATIGTAITPIVKAITIDLIEGIQKLNEEFIKNGSSITGEIFKIARSATFLIKPFIIAFNFIKTGFSILETAISGLVAGIALTLKNSLTIPLQSFAKLPGEIGQKAKSALQNLNLFNDAAQATLTDK